MSYLSNVLFGTKDQSLLALVPNRQLRDQSLHLVAPNKPFNSWSPQDHANSYLFMQRIAQAWKNSNLPINILFMERLIQPHSSGKWFLIKNAAPLLDVLFNSYKFFGERFLAVLRFQKRAGRIKSKSMNRY